ncbi:alpha/beta hydrolase-fold protein [Jiulongibacter sp. NS-SX5]|uniref:alpha/beta hydrolase-fold protein n=1 Tax=Jiulongibacter sp. NS-SX5 TaxID=3463854 RepID=UPI00405869AB
MQKESRSIFSQTLGKNLELKIYGHWGYPILVFPDAKCSPELFDTHGLIDSVKEKVDEGKIKIYAVENIDYQCLHAENLSSNIKIFNYQRYLQFVKDELIPLIQLECNVHRIGMAGTGFGGFHALNFTFKYPNFVNFLISMSGSYNIRDFLDGYFDDNVYFNSPHDFLPNAESWTYNHLKIVLSTSDEDGSKNENLAMSRLLGQKQIDHWYDEQQWLEPKWPLWNSVFPKYLDAFL